MPQTHKFKNIAVDFITVFICEAQRTKVYLSELELRLTAITEQTEQFLNLQKLSKGLSRR